MSTITAALDGLAVLLGDLHITDPSDLDPTVPVQVFTYVPEAITPPCLVMQAADPMLETGDQDATFNAEEYVLRMDVWCLVDLVANETATEQLHEIIAAVLRQVGPSSWWLEAVNAAAPVNTSEWVAHGSRITLGTWVTLT